MKFALLFLAATFAAGCDYVQAEQGQGSGVSDSQKRNVAAFDGITASGAFIVEVVCQGEQGVEVIADDNLLPLVKTEVRGGTLYLDSDGGLRSRSGVRVRITVPNIASINSSGASSFVVTNIKNERLTIRSSGASNIDLTGETGVLEMQLMGASNAKTERLIAARVTVELSGAGKASVFASQQLDAEVSGAGSITYGGAPKTVNSHVSGVGSISKRN